MKLFPRARMLSLLALLVSVTFVGCGGGDAPVPAAPTTGTPPIAEGVTKGTPNVGVPRGPDAVKALQQTKGK